MNYKIDNIDEKNLQRIGSLTKAGQTAEALLLCRRFKLKYPGKAIYKIKEAVLLGDQSPKNKKQLSRQRKLAASRLKKFISYAGLFEGFYGNYVLNEYFWFADLHRKQYQLGTRIVAGGDQRGYYPQGVGAATQARKLMENGKFQEARKWAQISEKAWLNYFRKASKDYYNAYCWYAVALGLQFKFGEMDKAFKRASELLDRPSDFPEFSIFKNMIFDSITSNDRKMYGKKFKMQDYWMVYSEPAREELLHIQGIFRSGKIREAYKRWIEMGPKYPDDVFVQASVQASIGDLGQYSDLDIELREKKKAAKVLLKLKKQNHELPWRVQYFLDNELCYHSGDFFAQYKLGKENLKKRPNYGHYSMGVGATELAHEFMLKKNTKLAQKWANSAIAAWKDYAQNFNVRLERDYFYIQALYLAGQRVKAKNLIFKVMIKNCDFENAQWARVLKRWAAYNANVNLPT